MSPKKFNGPIPDEAYKCPVCGGRKSAYAANCAYCSKKVEPDENYHRKITVIKERLYALKRSYAKWSSSDELFYQNIIKWLNTLYKNN